MDKVEKGQHMQWSHYSTALFDTFTSTQHNIIVQACPGAGKTTNIKHLWTLDTQPTVYLVFNKHNQIEAEAKLPVKVGSMVLTLNGLGHRILANNFGRIILDDKKVHSIARKVCPVYDRAPYAVKKKQREQQWSLIKAVSKAKSHMLAFDLAAYDSMLSTFDMEEYPGMAEHVQQCLEINDNDTSTIDYDDQIRLPALYDLDMPSFHTVLGDEVQDFSPVQACMVSKLKAQRYVLVGDQHQSIYGFRGAMCDSMQYLRDTFSCVQLPLSITYRCPTEVVQEAAHIYSDIEPWDCAVRGVVRYDAVMQAGVNADTLVLCRINAPLITLAYDLLGQGIACHVRGRDIGQGLIALIRKQDARDVAQLIERLGEWREIELAKAIAREDDAKAQRTEDRYNSIMLFCSKVSLHDDTAAVIFAIEALFEQGKGVCLSTTHKAKGLEARRCIILQHNLWQVFRQRAKHAWQREQEDNVQYVAVTRAQQELIYA